MNLTSKSRYALKIMMDLAAHQDTPHVPRQDIARRQGIPTDYLDQIMIRLRKGGLVESVRGRGGGYRLKKQAQMVSLWDIFASAEGNLDPVQCVTDANSCEFDASCIAKSAWSIIADKIRLPLVQMSLQDIVGQHIRQHQMCPAAGVRECRGPEKRAVGEAH